MRILQKPAQSIALICVAAIAIFAACGDDQGTSPRRGDFTFADPRGDTLPTSRVDRPRAHDLVAITGRYVVDSVFITLRFAGPVGTAGSFDAVKGLVDFDVDENAATGDRPVLNMFGGSATIGVDFTIDLFTADGTSAPLFSDIGTGIARVPVRYAGDSVVIRLPLTRLNGDEGNFRFALVLGTQDRLSEIAPNAGHLSARRR